ncbi:hypothetical protein [Methylorubrum zatmanii]
MTSRFHITFETVTPESVEHNDAAARGYVHPNGGRDDLDLMGDVADYAFDLRSAVRFVGENATFDCGRWFDTTWHDDDFRTGAETRYSLHPPRDITASSYARLARVLGARR